MWATVPGQRRSQLSADPLGRRAIIESDVAEMPTDEETALVVLVPEAEAIVSPFRSRLDRSAIHGMPAHVTVLYPFVHPDHVSVDLVATLRSLFAHSERFQFSLGGICGFPGVVYLVPDPLGPFDTLTAEVVRRFPAFPPYGGLVVNPVPHLTVAQKPPAESLPNVVSDFIESCSGRLPLDCTAASVELAVKRQGRWSIPERFPLS